MEIAPYINIDPDIHHGKPVISGTRVPVSLAIVPVYQFGRGENCC